MSGIPPAYSPRLRRIIDESLGLRYVVFCPSSVHSGAWIFRRYPPRPPAGVRDFVVFRIEDGRLRLVRRGPHDPDSMRTLSL